MEKEEKNKETIETLIEEVQGFSGRVKNKENFTRNQIVEFLNDFITCLKKIK